MLRHIVLALALCLAAAPAVAGNIPPAPKHGSPAPAPFLTAQQAREILTLLNRGCGLSTDEVAAYSGLYNALAAIATLPPPQTTPPQ